MTSLARAAHIASVAAILLLAILVPLATAQVADPAVSVTFAGSPAELGPGQSTVLNGTVNNDGPLAGTVTLSFQAPAGWDVVLDPATAFSLASGANAPFTLTISAPADANPVTGDLTASASIADQTGRSATSAPATATLTFVPPPPPVVIPWYQTPIGIAGIVLAILVVAGIVAAILLRRRNARLAAERAAAERAAYLDRETGITIAVPGEPLQYGHKREIVYRISVTNKSARPRVAIADIVEVTNGWRAGLQFSKIPLSPGETVKVTLVVTPDAVITPGDRASVVLRAKPEEALELSEKVTLDVVAPKHGVPADPHYRIVTVHREGANVGINR